MVNYLDFLLAKPQFNFELFFEVLREFRKGGINPTIYHEFLSAFKQLPSIMHRHPSDYLVFNKFNLRNISDEDFCVVILEMQKRGIDSSKLCWHPNASNVTCDLDSSGNIRVSAAHSIQNNGVLSRVAEKGLVTFFGLAKDGFSGKEIIKNHASIFWGFCNKHDAIFKPIEIKPYIGSDEQHFLFAYRGFVVAVHKKIEDSKMINFGDQLNNDIAENKKIFDVAILSENYSVIETEVFELPASYPIAVSSSFYLDFDFEGNSISHSEERIEAVFVTLLPTDNRTFFLLSYFQKDKNLYGHLGNQLRKRNNLKSDISILFAAHVKNMYFSPIYYKTFIEKYENILPFIIFQAQSDSGIIGENGQPEVVHSFTPSDYLNNPYGINFFGY
jgi:hypothetical protein